MKPCIVTLSLTSFLLLSAATVGAQQDTVTSPAPWDQPTALPDTPQVFRGDGQPYRVVPIKGLANPWALAVLPNGDILVTERVGRLRISGNQIGGGSGTTSDDRKRPGMEDPFIFWNPSPAVAGVVVYTGNRFPLWKGNIFVGAMGGKHLGARQLHRIVLSRTGRPQRGGNMTMLAELNQRIRDVKQGPDGLLYLTTDEKDGAVLRIEPVENKTN